LWSGSNTTGLSDLDTTATLITKGSGTPRLYLGNENAANRPFIQSAVGGGSLFMVLQPYGGNVLLGALTDSGNGKLQLASHTTSAGGIGFGTDTSLYRSAASTLKVEGNGVTRLNIWQGGGSSNGLSAYWDNSNAQAFIGTVGGSWPLNLMSGNGVTAVTLDSSQRTILSGALRLANAYVATPQTGTGYVTIQDSTGTTYKVLVAA
jgi:hypothetical protein